MFKSLITFSRGPFGTNSQLGLNPLPSDNSDIFEKYRPPLGPNSEMFEIANILMPTNPLGYSSNQHDTRAGVVELVLEGVRVRYFILSYFILSYFISFYSILSYFILFFIFFIFFHFILFHSISFILFNLISIKFFPFFIYFYFLLFYFILFYSILFYLILSLLHYIQVEKFSSRLPSL